MASGRVSRLTATGNVGGAEKVLVNDWCQSGSSGHAMQDVRFGPDGKLYVGAGDGARANPTDYGQFGNLCGDPPTPGSALTPPTAEGGSLRAQDLRTMTDPVGLDGSLIRIDPETGAGAPGNPLATGTDPNARRIVAEGLRNPFRYTFRPGTNEIWIGDVGWKVREEIDRLVTPADGTVDNFGWPCYEGALHQAAWDTLNVNLCENLYTTTGQTGPYFAYRHDEQTVPGGDCVAGDQASIGTPLFYPGGNYPDHYDNALFFSDYARQCLFVMPAGANGLPNAAAVEEFSTQVGGIVDLEIGPGGDLYYLDILAGAVHHIAYGGTGNQPPVAHATADRTTGPVPLTVAFNGSTSSDPEGGALTYAWDLDGDGAFDDSTAANPSRTYTTAGVVNVALRVRDPLGLTNDAHLTITVGNTLPVPKFTAPTATTKWQSGQAINFKGTATDAEDGTLPGTALDWSIVLFHCPDGVTCHQHLVAGLDNAASGSFIAPDHEYLAYLQITLTATDSTGATASVTRRLDAQTRTITMHSSPSGIPLGLNDESVVSPFVRTVIRNSNNTVSAPPTAVVGGKTYRFDHWSDSGAAIHNVVPNLNTTRTAYYILEPVAGGNDALFVVANPTSPNAGDRAVANRLTALGSNVTLADDNGITATAASGKELVVISSTVDPANVNATFAATAVPVITWENALYDDLALTGDVGGHGASTTKTTVALTSTGAAHPIGAGLSAGSVAVTTTAQRLTWGKPAASATVIATLPAQTANATVFAYPTGAAMVGRNAPARRVGLFLFDSSGGVLTAPGATLFDNSVRWALGQV